jgi:hypothetical protein
MLTLAVKKHAPWFQRIPIPKDGDVEGPTISIPDTPGEGLRHWNNNSTLPPQQFVKFYFYFFIKNI